MGSRLVFAHKPFPLWCRPSSIDKDNSLGGEITVGGWERLKRRRCLRCAPLPYAEEDQSLSIEPSWLVWIFPLAPTTTPGKGMPMGRTGRKGSVDKTTSALAWHTLSRLYARRGHRMPSRTVRAAGCIRPRCAPWNHCLAGLQRNPYGGDQVSDVLKLSPWNNTNILRLQAHLKARGCAMQMQPVSSGRNLPSVAWMQGSLCP